MKNTAYYRWNLRCTIANVLWLEGWMSGSGEGSSSKGFISSSSSSSSSSINSGICGSATGCWCTSWSCGGDLDLVDDWHAVDGDGDFRSWMLSWMLSQDRWWFWMCFVQSEVCANVWTHPGWPQAKDGMCKWRREWHWWWGAGISGAVSVYSACPQVSWLNTS